MAYPEPHQEPYTKYPNRYTDVIKPRLTGTQRDICDVVIRMTYGWHQTSAEISNTVFARKANKTIQGIIKARTKLEELGLLIVLEKGGGAKTSKYMIDLYYDNPDKSVRVSMLKQERQLLEIENPSLQEKKEDISELLAAPIIEEPQRETENHAPDEPNSEQEISDTESAENPSSIEDSDPPTSKLSLPPYKEDLKSVIYINKKTNNKPTHKNSNEIPNKHTSTVRCLFNELFPRNIAKNDWKFFGGVVKTYSVEACLAKLDYMKEHRKRHTITNPKGFFRTALVKDFQPPKFIMAKVKADENAKRERERCRKESEERRQITTDFNYGSELWALYLVTADNSMKQKTALMTSKSDFFITRRPLTSYLTLNWLHFSIIRAFLPPS